MNDLKQQRTALIAERETLENSLPVLDAEWRNAPSNYSPIGNMIGSPEKSEAMDRYSSAECRLRAIPSELDRIEQKIAYLERIEEVGKTQTESIQTMSEASAEVEALERTRSHLSERFQTIESEAEHSLGKAQQAERDAASLYARSLASGDSEGEKAATSEIQKAAKQLATTGEHVRRQELVLTALQAELDAIGAKILSAQRRGDDAKKAALNAIALELDEEWNAVTKQLVTVGAKMLVVSYEKGGMGDAFSRLEVPRFGPFLSTLDRSELVKAAQKLSLSDFLKK